jgi:predicted acylesterase/phospholipase RssA/CRP-like cAMP-binding protein
MLCAVAPTAEALIAARALQGTGAALLIPASLALVLQGNPWRKRSFAVAAWSATAVVAAGIGPSVGGALVQLSGWRLVFLINVPIGLVVGRISARNLVESRAPGGRGWPDLTGSLVLALAAGAIVLAIVQIDRWGPSSPGVIAALAAAVIGAAALVRRLRRHPVPVVDLALLRRRTFAVTSGLTLLGSIGFYAVGLANLLYLMHVWGYSALAAGLAFTPAPFVAAASAVIAGRYAAGRDARPLLLAGSLLLVMAPLWLALRGGTAPELVEVYLPTAIVGSIGIGLTFPMVSAAAVADAPDRQFAAATALNSGIREMGAAIGIALCVALLGTPAPGDLGPFERVWVFGAVCFLLLGVTTLLAGRIQAGSPAAAAPAPNAPATPLHPVVAAPAPRTGAVASRRAPEVTRNGASPAISVLPPVLVANAERVRLSAGEWLFRQGDEGDALYIVEHGRVEVVAEPPGEEACVTRELGPGGMVGELALISGVPHSASLRARRDSTLLQLQRSRFESVLRASPAFSRALLRQLAHQLSDTESPYTRGPASVVALFTTGQDDACRQATALFTKAFANLDDTAVLDHRIGADRLADALEQAERRHGRALLLAGAPGTAWATACRRQADRALIVICDVPGVGDPVRRALPRGADLAYTGRCGDCAIVALAREIDARSCQRIRAGADAGGDAAALARRMTGRSVGLVLSGGGARGFAHIGVIEELQAAGITIDRVAGVSMGAFVGALFAAGLEPDEIDRCCYEEWVRRNPVSDYRIPRVSLIRGARVRGMLERVLPPAFEDLVRPFACVSTDLIRGELVAHRSGELPLAVAASMSVPGIAPPVRLDNRLLCDGGVIDNLPVATMAAADEGPIIASDVTEPEDRHAGRLDAPQRDPSLAETLYRLVVLGAGDTVAAAHRHAQLVILPEREGVGRLEFHRLGHMRELGRRAAAQALQTAGPELFGRSLVRRCEPLAMRLR